MGATLEKSEHAVTVKMTGSLTLPQAEELKQTLIQSLEQGDDISLVLDAVQEVDLSLLQLMCSLHRTALQKKKRVKFEGAAPAVLLQAVEAAGYTRHAGCKLDLDKSCLWASLTGATSG
jgi:anti-anti-sigma regulatory factor